MKQIKHGKSKKVKVCDITPYDDNYIIHSKEQIEKIKRSIEEFGYRQKIGIDKKNVIVYGHGRWCALKEINPEMTIEIDDLSDLSADKIKRLRIVDNSLRSDDIDDKKLHAELQKIFPKLEANITNIQETMNIDISHIARKMDNEMANTKKNADLPLAPINEKDPQGVDDFLAGKEEQKSDPRPQRQASTKLAKIILEYTREDFDRVKSLSEKASAVYGVTSTSDLFLKMLEKHQG